MNLPSFQFYPGDWRKDLGVQSLSYHDRGVWFEMICLMHSAEPRGKLVFNDHAMSNEEIARALGLDNHIFEKSLTTLLRSGVASREEGSQAIICRRMVQDEKLRKIRAECGKKGGNPNLVNQKPTTRVNQKPTPSSSSSSSSSEVPKTGGTATLRFPETLEEAISACMALGCADEVVKTAWNKAMSRGGLDAKQAPIRSFVHYVKTEMKYEADRKGREKHHANDQQNGKPNPRNFGIPPTNNRDLARAKIARDNPHTNPQPVPNDMAAKTSQA